MTHFTKLDSTVEFGRRTGMKYELRDTFEGKDQEEEWTERRRNRETKLGK